MRDFLGLVVTLLAFSVSGFSEVVFFKNGDQLSGTWLRVEEAKLIFKSEVVGDVTIPLAKVKSFSASKGAVALMKRGEPARGELSLAESGDWELRTNGQTRRLATSSVIAIYPQEVYQPGVEERPVRPWRHWKGSGSLGYSLVRGDRDAGTLSIGFNSTRRQPDLPGLKERLRTNYFLNMLYANTRKNGERTSANSITSGLRQDFLFTPTNFVFLLGQLDQSQTQTLDLRQTYGLGLGRDVVRGRRMSLNLLGGTTYVHEKFQDATARKNAEGLIGEQLSLKISEQVRLEHQMNVYPNLTDSGKFRMDTTSTLRTRVSSRLSFNTSFSDRYLSQPLPGRQRNEFVLTTGLGINF